MRETCEIHDFSADDIKRILMQMAKAKIIGGFYCGEFGKQEVEARGDGYRVITRHTPEDTELALRRHRRAA